MIVVDTNVIAYLLITGERTAAAEEALRADAEWVAPLLWRSELCSVLTMQVRRGHLPLDAAVQTMEAAEDLMHGGEYAVRPASVLQLAASSGCSAYDCEYVTLARDLGVPLVTGDQRILGAFPDVAIELGTTQGTG